MKSLPYDPKRIQKRPVPVLWRVAGLNRVEKSSWDSGVLLGPCCGGTRHYLYERKVHWRSVHPQTVHATFRPTLSVHPTNCLLWHFTTVTFRLKVDGLSVHPKLWHSDLINLDGLSQCDKPSHCNTVFCPKVCDILSAHFSSNFAVTFHPNVTKGPFFPKFRPFLLTFTCDNWSLKVI